MSFLTVVLFIAGAVLLIFGFKTNNRALLTIAAFVWLFSGTWSDIAHGFRDGWGAGQTATSSTAH
jgi:hypothetical protein